MIVATYYKPTDKAPDRRFIFQWFDVMISAQKKMTKSSGTANNTNNNNNGIANSNTISATTSSNNFTRKPRRSIKAEGNCLNGMLREGQAHVIDASKLGKRLSSEIWNSFGAIQVQDNFTYPSIDTKIVADGSSTVKICQFFVACSKCFSVFKYDGHAYGTTGLVKHVKICQGTNQVNLFVANNNNTSGNKSNTGSHATNNATTITTSNTTHTSSSAVQHQPTTTIYTTNTNQTTPQVQPHHIMSANIVNGQVVVTTHQQQKLRKQHTPRSRSTQPNLKLLVKAIEELRCEQNELKQKIHDLINMMSASSYVGQIQIISNDGDKVEEELQKTD